jgi:hypothetical protein
MIAPLSGLRVLDERPYRPKRWSKRLGEWLKGYESESERELEVELQALLENVSRCKDRTEIAELLGRPVYAINGRSFGSQAMIGETQNSDVVECYSKARLAVELWFRDGRPWQTIGYVLPQCHC